MDNYCSLRKDCNSNVTYSSSLLVYNLFAKWKVVFDHIWKINSIASDFLYRNVIERVVKKYNYPLILWIR